MLVSVALVQSRIIKDLCVLNCLFVVAFHSWDLETILSLEQDGMIIGLKR